jgi:membrane dipeptidase
MEGADPIVDPAQAQWWWGAGLRSAMLAHYGQSHYAVGTGESGPLTAKGRELLAEFERLGMIVDLTHMSDPSFYEAYELFDGAIMASHNNCRALAPGDRQFSDEQIQMLIDRGAVIGGVLDAWMLKPDWIRGESTSAGLTLAALVDHFDHICQLAGNADHVAIGSDLDGGFGHEQTPADLRRYRDLHRLATHLANRGYSEADIDKIFHGNWLRFFAENLP